MVDLGHRIVIGAGALTDCHILPHDAERAALWLGTDVGIAVKNLDIRSHNPSAADVADIDIIPRNALRGFGL